MIVNHLMFNKASHCESSNADQLSLHTPDTSTCRRCTLDSTSYPTRAPPPSPHGSHFNIRTDECTNVKLRQDEIKLQF